jgi:uncharacterized SAM-binding protein YcdF (DUF218 family)
MPELFVGTLLPSQPEKRPRLWPMFVLALVGFAVAGFLNLGRWLVREDPLEKADAIAVLSGRMPDRALEAARIYKKGYAPEIWLTHSVEPGETLQKLSVRFIGEEEYDREILLHEGVSASAVRVLDPPIVNTADEMKTIAAALRATPHHSAILVTSLVHTRRTRKLWKFLSSPDGKAIVRGVSDDSFDPAHWWRNTGDALDVVREVLGLLNAWAGLPLKPAS